MKIVRLKHDMDKKHRIVNLDDAFKEALSLSEGCSCEQEELEYELLNFLNKYDEFTSKIKDDYKEDVLKSWDYKFDYNFWIDKIKKVETSYDKYPLLVNKFFISNMVREIHQNEIDFEEGDLLERIEDYSGYNFVLYEVELDEISYKGYDIDESAVDEYIEEPIETMPPIILETPLTDDNEPLGFFPLIDGAHRCRAIEEMGLKKIRAYIPTPAGIFE